MSRNDMKGAYIRELGRLEAMYHMYYQRGNAICVQMVRIQCAQCVTLPEVRRAAKLLCLNHPVLRMFIHEEENNRFYFAEMNPLKIDCNISCLSTKDLLQQEVNKRFLQNGPLWRLTVQRTESLGLENNSRCLRCGCPRKNNGSLSHTFSFVLSFHHSLIDGMYLLCVLSDFIKFLDGIQLNDASLQTSPDVKQMLPAIERYLRPLHGKEMPRLVHVRCESTSSLDALIAYERCYHNEIALLRTNPIQTEPVRLSMEKTKTSQFLSECKRQHILVSGAIMAAACIAFAKQLNITILPKANVLEIPVEIMVDMRRYLSQTFKDFTIFPGTAAIHLPFLVKIPLQENLNSKTLFWDIAKRCSRDLSDTLHSTNPVKFMREEVESEIQSASEGLGKSPYVLCISNLANVDSIVKPGQKPRFQLNGFPGSTCIGIDNQPIFEIVLFSLMNRLHFFNAFCSQYTSCETASRFSWELIRTIHSTSML